MWRRRQQLTHGACEAHGYRCRIFDQRVADLMAAISQAFDRLATLSIELWCLFLDLRLGDRKSKTLVILVAHGRTCQNFWSCMKARGGTKSTRESWVFSISARSTDMYDQFGKKLNKVMSSRSFFIQKRFARQQ